MTKAWLAILSFLIALTAIVSGCRPATTSATLTENERLELVKEIKAFEKKLGFNETENFAEYSDEKVYDYYFYTPVTELPYSLDDPALKFGEGKPQNTSLDASKYDVFYYSIPSLAGVKTPVTRSLLESPLHRFIFVIFHEDWHEQIKLPLGIEEASGEIIGYVSALLFTEERFGRDSEVYNTLEKELTNKLKESVVFQDYYDRLAALYADYKAGKTSETATLEHKTELIRSMNDDIYRVWGKRRDQLNNAFISFQMTYYRYLNLMYDVFSAQNSDVPGTINVLRGMPEQGVKFENDIAQVKAIEGRVAEYLRGKSQK